MTKKTKAAKKAMPARIYVSRYNDGECGTYLSASEELGAFEHDDQVSVYELIETKKLRIVEELV